MDQIVKKIYSRHRIRRYFFLILGTLICACAYNLFIYPHNLVFGGTGGISIIVNKFVSINPSLLIFGVSAFLFLIGAIFLPRETVLRSAVGLFLYPIFVEATSFLNSYINTNNIDMLVLAIFGGVLYGFGFGLVVKYGFNLGGTDFLTQIVHKYAKLTMGTSMFIVEGIIVLVGAFVFGITNFLYAVVILFLITYMTDKVVLGISDKKAFYIITNKKEEVSDFVIKELNHTVTVFNATGGFTNKKVSVLFTVIPTREYYKLKEGIEVIDKEAFFTVVDAYEVSGGE